MADLREYLAKRDFDATPEPSEAGMPSALALRYSIQNHEASHLHWDLRLEWQGVLLSWAIPKGPSYDPEDKRLAVRTEDHPLSYIHFEGTIPAGNYGAGTVMLWDRGWWQPLDPAGKGLAKGHLHFRIFGRRLTGAWNLVQMHGRKPGDKGHDNWLLVKAEDEAANQPDPVKRYTTSVETGRSFDQIAAGAPAVVLSRKGTLPAPIEPELATLVADLADPARFWHEIKFDGYRALIALGKGGPRAYTRSGLDWSDRFASLLPAFDDLTCDSALIDGEIVAGAGLQGFSALQATIKEGGPFLYAPFDLLSLDGHDLRPLPLTDRRKELEKLMKPTPPLGWIELSPVIDGAPDNAFAMICGAGGEGLVAKLRDAPYRSGRGKDWLKIKCQHRAEFVIVGYEASDKRGRPFSSLALAARQAGKLTYVGQVGTGFDEDRMADLAARMAPLQAEKPPVAIPAAEAHGVTWLRPELVAEIQYAELTAQDRLRHAVFIDLREDKVASEVVIEKEAAMPDPTLEGITITHPDRVLFPNGVTKGDVADYYAKIAPVMLTDTANRPVSLLRLPEGLDGERFFQKHPTKGFPAALKQVEITESSGKTEPYFYVTDAAGLVGAAQMGTVEFHIWAAHRDDVEKPDRLVFDLDPDEGLGFADVRDGAILLRKRLQSFGLEPGVMLSGGKGVHLVVPLKRTISWQTLKLFAEGVARLFAAEQPDRFVAEMSKAKRKGRIFIDWLRNERGATAIAPLSVRARPDAPVAAPISWEELPDIDKASAIGMDEALKRYAKGYPTVRAQGLTKAVIDALAKAAGG